MTDRVNALVVVLEKDVRDDDIERTRNAIAQIKGVVSVENNITDVSDIVAMSRVRKEVSGMLVDVLAAINKNNK